MFFGITYGKLVFICLAMGLAGFIDSIAGGGGCISLPAYLLTGLPAQTAIACNKSSACMGTLASTFNFLKNGKINVKVTIISAIFGVIGSNIGARIMLSLNPLFLQKMIVCIIPFVALFLVIKKDFGNENNFDTVPTRKVIIVSILAGFIIGLYDDIIGPGTGTFAVLVFAAVLKFDLKTSCGNAKLLNLATSIGSVVHYLFTDIIIWPIVITAAVCDIVGSLLGSSMAIKKEPSFIRYIMLVVVGILLIKLGIDAFM